MRCLVVGAPRVGSRWNSAHAQLKEAELVADMLRVTPLTDYQASKEAVLAQLPQAECIHFATHICWKTPAIVLSPGEVVRPLSHMKRICFTFDFWLQFLACPHFEIGERTKYNNSFFLQVDSQAKRLLNTSVGSGAADTSTENEEESTYTTFYLNFSQVVSFSLSLFCSVLWQTLSCHQATKNYLQHQNSCLQRLKLWTSKSQLDW